MAGHPFPDAYAEVREAEVWLKNFHIAELPFPRYSATIPTDPRSSFFTHQEIKRIDRKVRERGFTLIPLAVYLKHGLIKIELGLCRARRPMTSAPISRNATWIAISGANSARGIGKAMRITGGIYRAAR